MPRLGAAERACALASDRPGESRIRGDVRDYTATAWSAVNGEYETDAPSSTWRRRPSSGIANCNPISRSLKAISRVPGTCSRPAGVPPVSSSVVIASSDKAYGDKGETAATDRTCAASGPSSLRRQQELCRPHRAKSYATSFSPHPAGSGHAARNFYGGLAISTGIVLFRDHLRSVVRVARRPVIRSDGKYIRDYFYVEDGRRRHVGVTRRTVTRCGLNRGDSLQLIERVGSYRYRLSQSRLRTAMDSKLEYAGAQSGVLAKSAARQSLECGTGARACWRGPPLFTHRHRDRLHRYPLVSRLSGGLHA